jgi:hypothetical protein
MLRIEDLPHLGLDGNQGALFCTPDKLSPTPGQHRKSACPGVECDAIMLARGFRRKEDIVDALGVFLGHGEAIGQSQLLRNLPQGFEHTSFEGNHFRIIDKPDEFFLGGVLHAFERDHGISPFKSIKAPLGASANLMCHYALAVPGTENGCASMGYERRV